MGPAARIALSSVVFAGVAGSVIGAPPLFSQKTFEQAKEQASKEGKLFVVDSTAEWCGPCKTMDRTTWVDEKVVKWFAENAVAFQFDVDHDQKLAEQFGIRAMPTVIVVKEGKEFDRVVGLQQPSQLLSWLEGVKRGESSLETARKTAGSRDGKKVDVQARLDLARKLSSGGKQDEATDEYVWLWENMVKLQPSMVGVRVSFMASDMERLAEEHAPARERFSKMRDGIEGRLKASKSTSEDLSDWIVLNEVVGDRARTLAWFDRVKDEPEAARDIKRNDYRLVRLLKESGRWADVAKLSRDPVADAKQSARQMEMIRKMLPADQAEEVMRDQLGLLRNELSNMYAGLLAAGKDEVADKVGAVLIETSDDAESRLALVTTALEAGQARERHVAMLDEAEKKEANRAGDVEKLRAAVRGAMEEKK